MSLEVTFDGILLAEEGAAKWLEAMQEPAIDSDSDIDIKFIFIFYCFLFPIYNTNVYTNIFP